MNALGRLFRRKAFRGDYRADNFATKKKNWGSWTSHVSRPPTIGVRIRPTWARPLLGQQRTFDEGPHICVWAAIQALKIEGIFAECGVDTAVTSGTVIKYLDFGNLDREFFLFDTFSGIPEVAGMTDHEKSARELLNKNFYFDFFGFVAAKMAEHRNVNSG